MIAAVILRSWIVQSLSLDLVKPGLLVNDLLLWRPKALRVGTGLSDLKYRRLLLTSLCTADLVYSKRSASSRQRLTQIENIFSSNGRVNKIQLGEMESPG